MRFLLLIPLLTILNAHAGSIELKLTSGEVKILYPCSIVDTLEKEKEEKENLVFYEKGKSGLYDKGLILRHQRNDDDLSLKYRPHKSSITVDEELYSELKNSDSGELKCELDVTYHESNPGIVSSCAFETEGNNLTKEHEDFLDMLNLPKPNLDNLRSIEVEVTKWKLKIPDVQFRDVPFKKKVSVEMWKFRNECLLEVSAKFEGLDRAVPALNFLKDLIKGRPSAIQGNKTGLALGIEATSRKSK